MQPSVPHEHPDPPSTYVNSSRVDVRGAAAYLGTSERHVRRLVERRQIPFIKLGSGRSARLRFDTARLDGWIEEHSFEPEAIR
jgi:excisionase family DNA binding protein